MTPAQVMEAARLAADVLLALVSHEQARAVLDDAEIRRANALADAAERLKFGTAPTEPSDR